MGFPLMWVAIRFKGNGWFMYWIKCLYRRQMEDSVQPRVISSHFLSRH